MSTLEIEHLTPHIGSIVHNVDLADGDALERHGAEIRRLFFDRQVIFFRDQHLAPSDQSRFARLFGRVLPAQLSTFKIHPEDDAVCILESLGKKTQSTDTWHADFSYHESPPIATCLYAREVPEVGGDTMFASMTTAFESLDPKMQEYVRTLQVIHNWEAPQVVSALLNGPRGLEGYKDRRAKFFPATKPAVIEHPITGKEILYVNSLYNKDIIGMRIPQSNALLTFLTGLAEVPEWQVRFKWEPNSLAVWDNWATQHYAVNDYHPAHRIMHRVAIQLEAS